MPHIIIDQRESRSPINSILERSPGVTVERKELSSGDYLLADGFAVERKEATDFVLSIMDNRIFNQVIRLKAEYDHVVFLLHGDVYATRSAITPAAIRGAISYLITLQGVSVISVSSDLEAADLMLTMARHLQEGLGYEPPLRTAKPKQLGDLALYLVSGLPGVGPTAAKALLVHFGTPAKVFAATVPELCLVAGIGKKSAERIFEALHAGA